MWSYVFKRLLYNIPVFLGVILFVMLALRVNDPVPGYLGKNATQERYDNYSIEMGLAVRAPGKDSYAIPGDWEILVAEGEEIENDAPLARQPESPEPAGEDSSTASADVVIQAKRGGQVTLNGRRVIVRHNFRKKGFARQYCEFLWKICTLNFQDECWNHPGLTVGRRLRTAVVPTLSLTLPALMLTSILATSVGIISSRFRGRSVDRTLMILAVLGMSISLLVYIILGQYFGAYLLNRNIAGELFAIDGYEPGLTNWFHYCMLPILISVIVAMGYDTRFYRAVMVEESGRDYITTALAKGASQPKIMFVHMLKNAMIPIITRIMTTLPFLITGSIVMETYFSIPGMGQTLIESVQAKDFPVIQTFTAVFAALYILSNILTDVLYAIVDPRVRLS